MNLDKFIHLFLQTYVVPTVRKAVRDEFKNCSFNSNHSNDEDGLLSAKESADFIGDALPTFYGRTSRGEIATYGSGKKIFCKKSELIAWKEKKRSRSLDQIQEEIAKDLQK